MDKFQGGKFGLEKFFQNCYNIKVRQKKQMGLSANGRLRVKAHSGKHGNLSPILSRSRGISRDDKNETITVRRKKKKNKKKESIGAQQLTLGKLQIPIVI